MLDEAKVTQMLQTKKQKKQKGATMIEYALVVAGVAAIAFAVFSGDTTTGVGKAIQDKVEGAVTNAGTTPAGG